MLLLVHNTITEFCSEKSPSPPILVECPDKTPARPSHSFLWPRHHQIHLHRIFVKSGVASSGHFSTARVQSRRFDVHQKKGQHPLSPSPREIFFRQKGSVQSQGVGITWMQSQSIFPKVMRYHRWRIRICEGRSAYPVIPLPLQIIKSH